MPEADPGTVSKNLERRSCAKVNNRETRTVRVKGYAPLPSASAARTGHFTPSESGEPPRFQPVVLQLANAGLAILERKTRALWRL